MSWEGFSLFRDADPMAAHEAGAFVQEGHWD